MTRTDLACTVCRRHKANLKPRKSKLLPGQSTMLLCNECFDEKREPRFAIIMRARSKKEDGGGLESVRDYIKNHRYYGEKITLDELL